MKYQVRILKDNYTGRPKIDYGCLYKAVVPRDDRGNWKVDLSQEEVLNLIERGIVPHSPGENWKTSFSKFLTNFKVVLDGRTFILDDIDPLDKLKYQVLKNSGIIAESEVAVRPNSKGYFYVQERESERIVSKFQRKNQAFKIIESLSLREKKDLAAILDKRTRNLAESVVSSSLMMVADHDPDVVIKAFEDPDREYKALFKHAVLENVITKDKNGYFKYSGVVLGKDPVACVEFLKRQDNLPLLMDLSEQVKKIIG
ncbi:MAG: hypothetical protein RMM53_07555 [Bacteroidia bacterium]|nr:hypothetical protein [Bacteroidia bacterium]